MVYDYEYLKREILALTTIDLNSYKEKQMKRRIDTLIAKNKIVGYDKYVQALRTDKALFEEFVQALSLADEVVLADIYAARETDTLGVSSKMLANRLHEMGTKTHYFADFEQIEKFLYEQCMHGELLITMGAGDIVKVGEALVQ